MKGKAFETEREGRGNFGSHRLGKEVRVLQLFSLLFGYSACDFSYISVSISMLFLCVTTGRIDGVFTTVEFGVCE